VCSSDLDFKRDNSRMQKMEAKLRAGLIASNTAPEAVEKILHALTSFAFYSFPESHALSFALIAYASAYLKAHRPAEFFVGLLNAQPMGFYAPATLMQDARRHGVVVRPPCVQQSRDGATVEADGAIRIGLRSIRGLRAPSIATILRARDVRPFASVADFIRRTQMSGRERHTLSSSGALNALAGTRRQALWECANADLEFDLFAQAPCADGSAHLLTPMTLLERINADFATVGITVGDHPMKHLRAQFPDLWRADELALAKDRTRLRVGGSVICRQRPGTAKGFVFISLEDESGVANVIVRPPLFEAERLVITQHPALIIEGPVQRQDGVIHVKAERIFPLRSPDMPNQASHDFH
jgi:error-prone DNA polymerase